MRMLAMLILLFACCSSVFAAGSMQDTLHDRCVAAIAASGKNADPKALKVQVTPTGTTGFFFQFEDAAGGTFFCQICDDENPAALDSCGSIGLRLSYRPKDGDGSDLPAELEKKCAYFLQKEVNPRKDPHSTDLAMIKRVHITPDHTDKRWVYQMELDGKPYRCVIRKSDGDFSVDRKNGEDWRPIAGGKLF